VREFAEAAFERVGLDWSEHVVVDPALLRPAEVEHLVGDAARARSELDWHPRVSFTDLVAMMVDADLTRLESGEPHWRTASDVSHAGSVRKHSS
jgi:GDPmannose 4,6-dehydratase